MVKVKAALMFFLFFISANCFAQNVTAKAAVDSSHYQIGDYIGYVITVNSDKGTNVNAPALKDSLSGIDLLKAEAPASVEKDNKVVTTFRFILSKYDSGDVKIPPVAVKYSVKGDTSKLTALTNEVRFTVSSLKVNANSDIKDIKDPIRIPLDWKLVLLWILIGLIVVAALIYAIRYYMKKKAQRAGIITVIRKEPHETALEKLKALEEKKLWQSGRIKDYHSEITEIIRCYFEERFRVPALELTTGELLTGLNGVREAKPVIGITSDFLNNADMVKFAKFIPMNDINEEMMRQAYTVVNLTVPKPIEPQARETANV